MCSTTAEDFLNKIQQIESIVSISETSGISISPCPRIEIVLSKLRLTPDEFDEALKLLKNQNYYEWSLKIE